MPSGTEHQHLSVSEVGVFCSMHQAILLLHTNLSYISVWKRTLQLHPPLLLWLHTGKQLSWFKKYLPLHSPP